MAKMKIEVLAERSTRHGLSAGDRLIAALPRLAPIAARLAPFLNLRNRSPALRRYSERRFGLSAARPLPAWRRDFFRDHEVDAAAPSNPKADVLLFPDTFNRYFEPENLRAALRLLSAAGYRARVPSPRGAPLCCGRTLLAVGQIDRARAQARRMVAAFTGDSPIIGLEPSCLLTLRDEFRALLGPEADAVANRAMLLAEFLDQPGISLPLRPINRIAHVHGHCHQKSFGTFPATLRMVNRVPGLTVKPITSSCCGMAGTFGYLSDKQDISRAMAEASLLPAIRAAAPEDIIVADGTSCRHQIRDLANRQALHAAQVLASALPDPKP